MDLNPRELRGAEIVHCGGLKKRGKYLRVVPSQTHRGHYVVDTESEDPSCTCPDYEARAAFCKHIFAVEIQRRRHEFRGYVKMQPVGYTQDWRAYNSAQENEGDHFVELLRGLCDGVIMEPQVGKGRPRAPLGDVIFACTLKVFTTKSGRRATSDIRACDDLLDHRIHHNTISRYVRDPKLTPVLRELIRESASPLAGVERDFAIDASGFATDQYIRWFDAKWGKERKYARWMKAHAITGTTTHVVTDVTVTEGEAADTKQLPELIRQTTKRFKIRQVSADKAYLSRDNLVAVDDVGAVPFIPFKQGTGHGSPFVKKGGTKSQGQKLWERMFHFYQYKNDEFLDCYHKRSNVETVFSMIKRKFGAHLRSKDLVAQENEILLKFLCHNICVLIASIYELGIEPEFWAPKEVA